MTQVKIKKNSLKSLYKKTFCQPCIALFFLSFFLKKQNKTIVLFYYLCFCTNPAASLSSLLPATIIVHSLSVRLLVLEELLHSALYRLSGLSSEHGATCCWLPAGNIGVSEPPQGWHHFHTYPCCYISAWPWLWHWQAPLLISPYWQAAEESTWFGKMCRFHAFPAHAGKLLRWKTSVRLPLSSADAHHQGLKKSQITDCTVHSTSGVTNAVAGIWWRIKRRESFKVKSATVFDPWRMFLVSCLSAGEASVFLP